MWQLVAETPGRAPLGFVQWTALSIKPMFNAAGSISLTVAEDQCPAGWLGVAGARLAVLRDGKVIASGTWDGQTFDWTAADNAPGSYTLTFDTDLARLSYDVDYPTPSAAWNAQTQTATYSASGPAGTLMRNLVNSQIGPGALTARQVPGLTIGPIAGGASTSLSDRFSVVSDELRTLALAGGGLGFDVRDDLQGHLVFSVYQPRDLTDTIRFGIPLNNVSELHVTRQAPTCTVALVAGQGQGTNRALVEIPDPGADPGWGRRALFVDQRQTADQTEYQQAGMQAYVDGGEQAAASVVVVDTEQVQALRDYGLGDQISVVVPGGVLTEVVQAIQVDVDDHGVETVQMVVGSSQAAVQSPQQQLVRSILSQLSLIGRSDPVA